MKTLNLVLTYKWFDKIKSGEKTKEYREMKPYWNKRLFGKCADFDKVRFQRGYAKNAETIIFKIKKIYPSSEPNDLNVKYVWVIELERIKEEANVK